MTDYQEDQLRRLRAYLAERPRETRGWAVSPTEAAVPAVWRELESAGMVTIVKDDFVFVSPVG